jgi:hypothetical protein
VPLYKQSNLFDISSQFFVVDEVGRPYFCTGKELLYLSDVELILSFDNRVGKKPRGYLTNYFYTK